MARVSNSPATPAIGIVVPVYGHPKLVSEALASVIEQVTEHGARICIVNDGCRLRETEEVIRAWAAAYPDVIHPVRRPNGGLSAARNTGIRFLLGKYPSLEAIYLLDADNLLEPHALSAFERLLERHPDGDWFYPEFDMFGAIASGSSGGEYSVLMHSADNMCEAGSLVRRRVFEAGVFFDEDMRLGYEDWDFWLSAAGRGFRGIPVRAPIFRYRKRPESMLSGSHRHDAEIRGYLRRKHKWLYSPRIVDLEHEELPRYRVILTDTTEVLALTDPLARPTSLTAETFTDEVWHWMAEAKERSAGCIWVFTTRSDWDLLTRQGVIRFALWEIERRLIETNLTALQIGRSEEPETLEVTDQDTGNALAGASMVAFSSAVARDILSDAGDNWISSITTEAPQPKCRSVFLRLPTEDRRRRQDSLVSKGLVETMKELRKDARRAGALAHQGWRSVWLSARDRSFQIARDVASTGPLYPMTASADNRPTVCFLMAIAEYGGVELVTATVASTLKSKGFRTALCVTSPRRARLPAGLEEAYDEFLWLLRDDIGGYGGGSYEGTHLPSELSPEISRDLMGLLGGFDVVISCHGGSAMTILGSLKKAGVTTAIYDHVLDTGPYGRTYGMPVASLAYEAGADFVLTCSQGLRDWMLAHGIPDRKVIAVPNAAGYPMSTDQRYAVVQSRDKPRNRPLRLLYLGRFDWQKGLDRLARILHGLAERGLTFDAKVVGSHIIDADVDLILPQLESLAEISPPAISPSEHTELYRWANIVLLPSRFEGLPLTIVEAQRCGAVPIVTDVGRVREAVDHDMDGFVVEEESCIETIIDFTMALDSNRGKLERMSHAAAANERSWEVSCRNLVERLREALDKK